MSYQDTLHNPKGPHPVSLQKDALTDRTREGRTVPYKIYHPSDLSQKYPAVIWSHGFGGNRDGAAFLSRYLAENGYIVIHPTHIGTDSSLWEGKPGHPWDILQKVKISRAVTLDRFRDVPFLLDNIAENSQKNPVFKAIDLGRIGMAGHSFGAMTTQVMAGMKVPDESGTLIQMQEPRFKAGVTYSPTLIDHLSDAPADTLYGSIAIPLFHQTGTEDSSPIGGYDYKKRLEIFRHAKEAPQYLLVKEGGDHMVYNGTRGKLQDNPNRTRHEEIVKIASRAYWDSYLREDAGAYDWLTGQGFQDYLGTLGEFKVKS